MMNRREMLAACATLPLMGMAPAVDPRIVQFVKYEGPGKKNKIDPTWAESYLAVHGDQPPHVMDFCLSESPLRKLDRIVRLCADDCILPEAQAEWFTAGAEGNPEHWKEKYLWHGHVRLVKDTMYMRDGKVHIEYYICRGERAIALRPALASEHAC